MALRWLEAGLACQNAVIFGRLYPVATGSIGTTFADEFGRAVFDSTNLVLRTPALVGSVENTWVTGFGLQLTNGQLGVAPSAFPGIFFRNSVGEQLRLEAVDASETKPGGAAYKLRVMRGATELARTVERFSGLFINTSRTYFEFKAVVRTGVNGSFSLRYHTLKTRASTVTATWSAANTGINTANQGTDGADRVVFSWATGGAERVLLNDIYVLDSTGAKNNDFIGVLYMEALKPDGTGTTNQWILAGAAASVEDALDETAGTQSTAEDDRRVTSDNVGDITLATMGNVSSKFGTTPIIGTQVRLYGKMETVGTRDVQFFYRKTTGTPAQVGTSILDLDTTSIVGEADTQENDPNTATDYVLADLQGIQLGFELDA